jgi:hypothetical protein
MDKRKIGVALIISAASLCAVALVLGRLNWRKYHALALTGVATEGRITAKEPANHLSVRYSYAADQKTFNGLESVGNTIDSLNVGDKVRIFYLPKDLATSCFCDPKDKLRNETLTILLAAFTTSVVVLLILLRRLRSKTRKEARESER